MSALTIQWTGCNSVLLRIAKHLDPPIYKFWAFGSVVPIGQVWVALPDGLTTDVDGKPNVYLAGEVVALDSNIAKVMLIAQLAENPGALRISSTRGLPGVGDHLMPTATIDINYSLHLRDPIKLLSQSATWPEDGGTALMQQLTEAIDILATAVVGDGTTLWTSATVEKEAGRIFGELNNGLLQYGLCLGSVERASKAQFTDFTATRKFPDELHAVALQLRAVEFELLQAVNQADIHPELFERMRREGELDPGVGLLNLVFKDHASRNKIEAWLKQAGIGAYAFRDYIAHLSRADTSPASLEPDDTPLNNAVVRLILTGVLKSDPLIAC